MTLKDLHDRLARAESALKEHSKGALGKERIRLQGKAEGVYLAKSYVEEMLRAERAS